jgi:hypothetical protein
MSTCVRYTSQLTKCQTIRLLAFTFIFSLFFFGKFPKTGPATSKARLPQEQNPAAPFLQYFNEVSSFHLFLDFEN